MDDVRAAAEFRLRRLFGSCVDQWNAPSQAIADMWTLAHAYLAEHPADDGQRRSTITWHPGGAQGENPEFSDGDKIIAAVPVRDRRISADKWYWEYHIITASCDSENPLVWNDVNGEAWCAWDWSCVEWWTPAKFDLPLVQQAKQG
jgi:hypothetical protein